jgi:threonylcarbamoyladenosine tRNA methylthiotransferase MtaB
MTVSFKTFGCRLNRAETVAFEAAFAAAGVACVRFGAPADVVVLHTCAVTQAAEDECLKLLRTLRRNQPSVFLVMAGCAVEAVAAETLRAAGADLVVARGDREALARTVLAKLAGRFTGTGGDARGDRAGGVTGGDACGPVGRRPKRALLKVQDGCDFFCAYCIVPHTRGEPRSRPFGACLREAERFIGAGYREIVVTGCNLACYADGGRGFVDLLAALAALPGLGRLRLGSVEPGTVEGEVAAFMASSDRVCKFLHLPVQSGDDGVLARMGRRYTAAQAEAVLRQAQARMPDAAFGADFICGFPGETEAAFERTLALVAALPFSKLHVFPYSERQGTPACGFDGVVPLAERRHRAKRLIALGRAKREAFARRFLGKTVEFVIEHFDREGRACGWSGEYLPCAVGGVPRDRLGQLCAFAPERVTGDTLLAAAR